MARLTAAAVLKYKPGKTRREIPDTTQGLRLVIQPGGFKSWAVRLRRPDGRPAKITLGPVDLSGRETSDEPVMGAPLSLQSARELAARLLREKARGVDVAARVAGKRGVADSAAADTFGAAAIEFIVNHRSKHGGRPRRWYETARLLGLRFAPGADLDKGDRPTVAGGSLCDVWGQRSISDIQPADIIGAVDAATRSGVPGLPRSTEGYSAARGRKLFSALGTMFSYLQRRRRVVASPCAGGLWRPAAPRARDRVLSDSELSIYWRACEGLDAPYRSLLRLLLLTGCRRGELVNLRHNEIVGDTLVLPGERVKNHLVHKVWLSPLAREQLAALPRIEGQQLVFVGGRGSLLDNFGRIKPLLDAAMTEIASKEGHPPIAPFIIHDVRRSFASGLQGLGIRFEVIEKLLNHVQPGISGVYQRGELWEQRVEALRRWSDHIAGLIRRDSKVTPLRARP